MRIKGIAGRCKLAARSLTISGLYAPLNYRNYDFYSQKEIASVSPASSFSTPMPRAAPAAPRYPVAHQSYMTRTILAICLIGFKKRIPEDEKKS